MGNWMSEEQRKRRDEEDKEELKHFAKKFSEGPNLRVSDRIEKFTSLDSSKNLRKYYEKRKMEAGDCAAVLIKKLEEILGVLMPAPELAGIGALAVAMIIDIESSSSSGIKDALRSVFAEEKISKVWDQIDECLKRCRMNIKNKDELVKDIGRIECQLSEALTTLKNSMLRDGHMSSEALKVWVNGAAFHIQMRIHLVRLGGSQTCDPVEELISTYKNDLDQLFKEHKEMIKGKCRMCPVPMSTTARYFVNEDSDKQFKSFFISYDAHFEAYYDHRYGRQRRDIHQYFSDVGQNLQELTDQRGSFSIN